MSTLGDVITGPWKDYSHGSATQILASDFWAAWMKALVAVGLTLSGTYVFEILKSFFLWIGSWWNPVSQIPEIQPLLGVNRHSENALGSGSAQNREALQGDGAQQDVEAHQNQDIQRAEDTQNQHEESLLGTLARSRSGRETMWNFFQYAMLRGADFYGSHATIMVIIGTALLAALVAQTVANVFSADIATGRAALSSSTECGIWAFDDGAGDEAASRADLRDYQKEARAGEYARSCYDSPNATDSMRCDFFYYPSIAFTSKSLDKCPFESYDVCLDGLYSAVTFDSGFVDASQIGVNFETTYKFRRKTTSSPLNMNYSYVRNETSHNTNDATYYYNYGSTYDDSTDPPTNTNYTYKTSGNPFDWLAPVYSINTYSTSLYPEEDYWRPIKELTPLENSTLTIIFVSSMHIYHIKPSYDPIFPAVKPHYIEGYRDPYYFNSDPKARALACVDTTELCSPNGDTCWSMTAALPDGILNAPAYWLMKWSLENSNIYDSIKWRLGTALLAQERVSQSRSQPLSDNHWEREAEQLFKTSLARIQFDAWSIGTGEDRGQPGYIEITPDEGKGKLCRLYKFNSIGYTNVNLGAFIGLLLTPFFILFLSLEARGVRSFFVRCCSCGSRGSETPGDDWEPLIVNIIVKYLFLFIFLIPRILFRCAACLYKKLKG